MVRAVWHAGRTPRSLDPRVPARRSAGDSARLGCQPPSPLLPSPHRTAPHRIAGARGAAREPHTPVLEFAPGKTPVCALSPQVRKEHNTRELALVGRAASRTRVGGCWFIYYAGVRSRPPARLRMLGAKLAWYSGAHLCGARLTDVGTALTRLVNPWRRAGRANESSGGAAEESGKERLTSEGDLPLSPVCSRHPLSRSPARRR